MRTRFYAYLCDEGACHAHPVGEAADPVDAAIRFLECHGPAADEAFTTVVVDDRELGHQHCFQVSLETGKVAPC